MRILLSRNSWARWRGRAYATCSALGTPRWDTKSRSLSREGFPTEEPDKGQRFFNFRSVSRCAPQFGDQCLESAETDKASASPRVLGMFYGLVGVRPQICQSMQTSTRSIARMVFKRGVFPAHRAIFPSFLLPHLTHTSAAFETLLPYD